MMRFSRFLRFTARLGLAGLLAVAGLGGGRNAAAEAQTPASEIGRHQVQFGDTLFSLGRAYGVQPGAIATANGLGPLAWLTVGQVLIIPAAPWANPPSGPVSAPQFVSAYPGLPATLGPTYAPTGSSPAQTGGANPGGGRPGQHLVRAGETLYSIGRGYGVPPYAIAAANGLGLNARLYPGQWLFVPAVRWANVPAGPVAAPQFTSPVGYTPPSGAAWPVIGPAGALPTPVLTTTGLGGAAPSPTAEGGQPAPTATTGGSNPDPAAPTPTSAPGGYPIPATPAPATPEPATPAPGGYPAPVTPTPGAYP